MTRPAATRGQRQALWRRPGRTRDATTRYLRVSQKEPFDILYFTPAITLIGNLGDGSFTAIPEVTYAGIENVELRLRFQANFGGNFTEYGESRSAIASSCGCVCSSNSINVENQTYFL